MIRISSKWVIDLKILSITYVIENKKVDKYYPQKKEEKKKKLNKLITWGIILIVKWIINKFQFSIFF